MGGGEESGARSHALEAGWIVAGRYRVEALLGRGASGDVYRVSDRRSVGKRLALKRLELATHAQSSPHASQFEREYHTLCQLAHPRIIEVYDYGVEREGAFYTMELLDGQDLRERGQLPWRQACSLLYDVASSLAILHARRLLHRDVSARNVRCTADGRAKLFDFGAMTPMGVAKHLVGTPPFVPPEALQLQALDARADLYALGALAYYVLTGRYAYPARTFEQLVDLWRSPPPSIATLVPDAPEALDRLVMQLLHLDRAARPRTAAEVMERLCGIAGLSLREHAEVGRAYLVTPTLIGRERAMSEVRDRLIAGLQGQGASVVIDGPSGSGRSRLLDACVLEARLLGAVVVRADADDGSADYGAAQALCARLFEAQPELSESCAHPHRALLDELLEAHRPSHPPPAAAQADRSDLHGALRDFVLSFADARQLVIAVDDVESIDAPSAAVLAALADHAEQHKLTLLFAAERDAPSPALAFIRALSRTIELEALSADQTAALLRALFGDAEHIDAIAERIHELSEGNPRFAMALAERLVDRGVARYEAGSWTLPAELAPGDLPESLQAALAARVAALPPDARALAETLALTEPSALPLDHYFALTGHEDHGRTYRAIDALLSASVLAPAGDRYRFAQRELGPLLIAGLDAQRERELHARIAAALEPCDDPVLVPHHLLFAGREREAIERLLPLRTDARAGFSTRTLALLERAVPVAERLALPPSMRSELQVWLVDHAANLGDYARFLQYAPALLARLERESGLPDYAALDPALPAGERLTRALTQAHARCEATPEPERGLPPAQAIPLFARVCAIFANVAGTTKDITLVERLPSIAPLVPLSPALGLVQRVLVIARTAQSARFDEAGELIHALIERIKQPDRAGLDPSYYKIVYQTYLYQQALMAAGHGVATTLAWTAELEQESGHRANAWRIRMTHFVMQGDTAQARECKRRAELLALQDGGKVRLPGSASSVELHAYSYAEDLIGVKRTMERIEQVAALSPGWLPTLQMARATYRLLQGDALEALDLIAGALGGIAPGRHVDWPNAARIHVDVLNRLGRHAEAVELGERYLTLCREHRLFPSHRGVMRVLADALTAVGRLDEALELADGCIREYVASNVRGLTMGMAYETRARVAVAMRDGAAFHTHAARCGEEYRRGDSPMASAKYERLMRDAEAVGMRDPAGGLRGADPFAPPTLLTASASTAASRLLACTTGSDRTREALTLLMESTAAQAGYLFGMRDGALVPVASSEPAPVPESWAALLALHLDRQHAADSALTEFDVLPADGADFDLVDVAGRRYEALPLLAGGEGAQRIAGLFVLYRPDGEHREPSRALLETIAAALLGIGVQDPVTRVA